MYNATEQFAEINKAGYDNAVKLASLSLDKAEQFAKLNLQAAKIVLENGVYTANAVAGIKDVQEFAAVRAKLTEAGVQNALGYSRGVYQIASEAQADFSALAEQAWAAYTKGFAVWVDNAAKNAPAGSDVAVTALKSTVAATTAAFDSRRPPSRLSALPMLRCAPQRATLPMRPSRPPRAAGPRKAVGQREAVGLLKPRRRSQRKVSLAPPVSD